MPRRHHAEDSSIPIDWSISIDDEGNATVDEGPGRIVAGSDNKQGKASSQDSAPPQTPAGIAKKQDEGEQLTLIVRRLEIALLLIGDARVLDVSSRCSEHLPQKFYVVRYVREEEHEQQMKVFECVHTGPIRGGGAGVKGNAQEAIAAIRNARELLGEGPRFKEVDGTAINAGTASIASTPAHPVASPSTTMISVAQLDRHSCSTDRFLHNYQVRSLSTY